MKKIGIFILLFSFVFLMSCGLFDQYEDTNGEDNYALQSITEEMLMTSTKGLQIGAVTSSTKNKEEHKIKKSVHQFDGVEELAKIKSGSYEIVLTFKVNSGNTRLVLTDGNKVIHEFLINEESQIYNFDTTKSYYLKLGGECLNYELDVTITKK